MGVRFWRDSGGALHTDLHAPDTERIWNTLTPEAPAVLSRWGVLHLDFETAKRMQRDLDALWRRYAEQTGPQAYAVRLAVAPIST